MDNYKIVDLVSIILFAIAELLYIILTIKCFAVESFRREPTLIAICITFHMLLIFSGLIILYYFNDWLSNKELHVINFCSVLSKDFLILVFTNRILTVLLTTDNENKVQSILIKIIWILIPLHLIISAVMLIAERENEIGERTLLIYLTISQSIFAFLYFYSCWKILPHFKNQKEFRANEYSKWLLASIIYMIFAIQIRIFNNASMYFEFQKIIGEENKLRLSLFSMTNDVITGLVPSLFLGICLLKLSKEEFSSEDDLKSSSDSIFEITRVFL